MIKITEDFYFDASIEHIKHKCTNPRVWTEICSSEHNCYHCGRLITKEVIEKAKFIYESISDSNR